GPPGLCRAPVPARSGALPGPARRRTGSVRADSPARVACRRLALALARAVQRLLGRRGARGNSRERLCRCAVRAARAAGARVAQCAAVARDRRAQRRGTRTQDRSGRALRLAASFCLPFRARTLRGTRAPLANFFPRAYI